MSIDMKKIDSIYKNIMSVSNNPSETITYTMCTLTHFLIAASNNQDDLFNELIDFINKGMRDYRSELNQKISNIPL